MADVNVESGAVSGQADAGAATTTSRGREGRDTQFGVNDMMNDIGQSEAWAANLKRTYDITEMELQRAVQATADHLNNLRTAQSQMLANMVVNCDNLQKQHLAHRDIATNSTWTVDKEAFEAIVAAKLTEMVDKGS